MADAGPIRYAVLIGTIDAFPTLFDRVLIPAEVLAELRHSSAPTEVRSWARALPSWIEVRGEDAPFSFGAHAGERAAIELAAEMNVPLLADDREARIASAARGLDVRGTLAILIGLHANGALDISVSLARLSATNFRVTPTLRERVLRLASEAG